MEVIIRLSPAIQRSVTEIGGAAPLMKDPRFMLGRGGMFVMAVRRATPLPAANSDIRNYLEMTTLARALLDKSPTMLRELQADGLTLLALPFILRLIKTPGAAGENAVLDLLVEPILGLVCFLTGVVF
jgi:hypothetical protein